MDDSLEPACALERMRVPSDSQLCTYGSCMRKIMREDSHWICLVCREYKAKCAQDCKACVALVEDEWRRVKVMQYMKKKENKKNSKPRSKCSFTNNTRRSVNKSGISKNRPKSTPDSNRTKKRTCSVIDSTFEGIENFLYGNLNIELPRNIIATNFKLPEIPAEYTNRYTILKNELIRLMSTASVAMYTNDHFLSESESETLASGGMAPLLFKPLIKHKANSLANFIFQMREYLLTGVIADEDYVVKELIMGEINPEVSFFGIPKDSEEPSRLFEISGK